MIHLYPTVPFGTVAASSLRVLGRVPPSGKGLLARGFDLYTSTAVGPSNADYWSVQVGVPVGGSDFTARAGWSKPLVGIALGRNAVDFPLMATFAPGETIAVRVQMTGAPSTLTECDIVVRLEEA